ncbi:MAG: hypothetical protein QF619_05815 [Candidatus Binatia bacterium]|jgi:hypothetical protein|nr:hypothetical protein [Candidatus Binatia bacterium]
MDTENPVGSRLFAGKTVHLIVGRRNKVVAGLPMLGEFFEAQVRLICHMER